MAGYKPAPRWQGYDRGPIRGFPPASQVPTTRWYQADYIGRDIGLPNARGLGPRKTASRWYDGILQFDTVFSPDSKRVAYVAQRGKK